MQLFRSAQVANCHLFIYIHVVCLVMGIAIIGHSACAPPYSQHFDGALNLCEILEITYENIVHFVCGFGGIPDIASENNKNL